jgi:hypothetical protein
VRIATGVLGGKRERVEKGGRIPAISRIFIISYNKLEEGTLSENVRDKSQSPSRWRGDARQNQTVRLEY